jgi:hypothetical protein
MPAAALLIATLSAGAAAASSFHSDRGYDDARSYAVSQSVGAVAKAATTLDQRADTSKGSFKGFNKKFGSPDRNFESGRR